MADQRNGDEARGADLRKCPRCAELIQPEAQICRFCNAAVASRNKGFPFKWFVAAFFILLSFMAYELLEAKSEAEKIVMGDGGSSGDGINGVTMAKFQQLETGMTYRQAVEIIGAEGEEMSRSELAGYTTVMYVWKNLGGSNMNAMFQNGHLVAKAQFGLQ
jgi:hypothetical protein